MSKIKVWFNDNWFKLLAIGFLLGALGQHQCGYYQLIRWIMTGSGVYLSFLSYNSKREIQTWTFGVIALIFNPILPFHFLRSTWYIIDIITAIIFSLSFFYKYEDNSTNSFDNN